MNPRGIQQQTRYVLKIFYPTKLVVPQFVVADIIAAIG